MDGNGRQWIVADGVNKRACLIFVGDGVDSGPHFGLLAKSVPSQPKAQATRQVADLLYGIRKRPACLPKKKKKPLPLRDQEPTL